MQKLVDKISAFLKDYWNIYAPPILSTLISWLTNWNVNQLQFWNQYFGNIISLMCLFTMLKFIFFPNKKKNGVEKIVTSQKIIKNSEIGKDVEGAVDETIVLIKTSVKGGKKIMEKVKNFFKWIWYYKEQLIGYLGDALYASFVIYVYIEDKFDWILNYLPQTDFWFWSVKIGYGVLSAIFLFYNVRNSSKWVGIGKTSTAKEYFARLTEKIVGDSTLSDKAKKKINDSLKTMNKTLKEANLSLEKYKVLYNKAVDEVNVFQELISNQLEYDNEGYQNALTNANKIKTDIDNTQATIDSLSAKIEHYNEVLNPKKETE